MSRTAIDKAVSPEAEAMPSRTPRAPRVATVSPLPRIRRGTATAIDPIPPARQAIDPDDGLALVEAGLPVQSIAEASELTGLPTIDVLRVIGMSERTFARRKVDTSLTRDESDRVMRLFRLVERSSAVVGQRNAKQWLNRPSRAFDGRTPLDLAETETGAALVFDLLGRIEHGVFS
jgi:putative toxin-antitoxin system antitoxin component (TIGR02293 family)